MRRFVTVVALLFFTIPFGISITGCGKKAATVYCNGGDAGVIVGQVALITLQPKIYGISLNQAEAGQVSTPAATDCKGTAVTVGSYTYGTTDMTIADVQPTTGRLCGGTWNKNTGGGVADYTTCVSTGKSGIAYVTATAGGTSSNPLPVYIHPVVTSVVLGSPAITANDCATDPSTNCSPASTDVNLPANAAVSCTVAYANGCCAAPAIATVAPYLANGCLSQQSTGQLAARVYSGTAANQTNISCQVGHVTFAAQSSGIVTIDQNGVATAQQPGSSIINASVSLSGSSAGFFSTCPPADIALSFSGTNTTTGNNIIVNQNNTQPISATVTDTKGVALTGLTLEYVSTTPITIPAASNGTVTPVFPGQASITAICQPPTCNTAPQSQIGVFGNGKPITSKDVSITTPGTNSTFLYIASTDSQYLATVDFTQTQIGAPLRLPYLPSSIAISNDGSTIYLGSSTELMVVSAPTSTLSKQDITVRGNVLAVSPDNSTIVISDPVRQQIYLYTSAGAITTTYGGVGTHAAWSPDSQTVYIAAGNQILVHSSFSGWKAITPAAAIGTDVAVTVPAVGAYFSGAATTARGYCPASVTSGTTNPPAVSNEFYPQADTVAALTDRLAATSDGFHILGAAASTAALSDIQIALASVPEFVPGSNPPVLNPLGSLAPSGGIVCPQSGGLIFNHTVATTPLAGIAPTAITGVLPTSDSTVAFITYTGTGGVLPAYQPPNLAPSGNTSGVGIAGTLTNISLSGTAVAPVAGTISADNKTIYVGTSGDSLVHIISTGILTDTKTIAPALPSASGTAGSLAVPNLLVERPRPAT